MKRLTGKISCRTGKTSHRSAAGFTAVYNYPRAMDDVRRKVRFRSKKFCWHATRAFRSLDYRNYGSDRLARTLSARLLCRSGQEAPRIEPGLGKIRRQTRLSLRKPRSSLPKSIVRRAAPTALHRSALQKFARALINRVKGHVCSECRIAFSRSRNLRFRLRRCVNNSRSR